jgi:hypothetical protein
MNSNTLCARSCFQISEIGVASKPTAVIACVSQLYLTSYSRKKLFCTFVVSPLHTMPPKFVCPLTAASVATSGYKCHLCSAKPYVSSFKVW